MKAVLCAAGSGSRWRNYTGRRKHMANLEGEAVLQRTTRQLIERGVTDVTITQITQHPYQVKGAKPAFVPSGVAHSTSRKHTWGLWGTDAATLLLLGDAFFSDEAMDMVVALAQAQPRDAYHQIGRLKPSAATGKPGGEMFGWVLGYARHHEFIKAVEVVETRDLEGVKTYNDWTIYQAMCGRDLDATPEQIAPGDNHLELPDDGTDDCDFPDDYERWMAGRRLSARRINRADFDTPWMAQRCEELKLSPKIHRKRWEHAAIAQAYLDRYGNDKRRNVLGFGVGGERLPAWFAAQGCSVVATDKPEPGLWGHSKQHAAGISSLVNGGICPEDEFAQRVQFRGVDMRDLPSCFVNSLDHDEPSLFDFLWSSSTIEHLGGISQGLQFVLDSMRFLKPGGVAVHTSEVKVTPGDLTLQGDDLCIFRESDLDLLRQAMEHQGDRLWPIDMSRGKTGDDLIVDEPPFTNDVHIHLALGGVVFTSVMLIAMRGYRV